MSKTIGVEIKNTTDFPKDFIVTNTYIPNTLERISKISEISIINHTNIMISVTDVNGVISKHHPVKLNDTFINMLGITKDTRYVYLIERRVVGNDDLSNTIRYNSKNKHKGDLYNIIHTSINAIPEGKKTNEIYIIYQIDVEYILLKRKVSLKEVGLSVSLVGYEEIPYGHYHNSIENEMEDDCSKILSNKIVFYHNNPKEHIYINILNKTIRIDSIPIESELEGEGVMFFYSNVSGVEKMFIKPSMFKKHSIYQSVNEAETAMNKEEILANKKLDIELMSAESRLIQAINTDMSTLYKAKMDIINKKIQILGDIEKARTIKNKEVTMSNTLDNIKKYIDVINMIKKLILI